MYTPTSESARNYRTVGYWFATGWWFAQPRGEFVPDHSTEFGEYCARRRDEYEDGTVGFLPSVPDLWTRFKETLDDPST